MGVWNGKRAFSKVSGKVRVSLNLDEAKGGAVPHAGITDWEIILESTHFSSSLNYFHWFFSTKAWFSMFNGRFGGLKKVIYWDI